MLGPTEAVAALEMLTEANHGQPVWILPMRIVDNADGSASKLPKSKWDAAGSTPNVVRRLWEERNGGYVGVHLARSGILLADQDFEEIPQELEDLLAVHPTFTTLSLRKELPHRWYRHPNSGDSAPRDQIWKYRGTHIGDLKSKGIAVLGTKVIDDRMMTNVPVEILKYHGTSRVSSEGWDLYSLVRTWLAWLDEPPSVPDALSWAGLTLSALERAPHGDRNNRLYRASRDVAQIVAAGAVTPTQGVRRLMRSASMVFTEDELRTEVIATIESAFENTPNPLGIGLDDVPDRPTMETH